MGVEAFCVCCMLAPILLQMEQRLLSMPEGTRDGLEVTAFPAQQKWYHVQALQTIRSTANMCCSYAYKMQLLAYLMDT